MTFLAKRNASSKDALPSSGWSVRRCCNVAPVTG
jgi:hypothetical protein